MHPASEHCDATPLAPVASFQESASALVDWMAANGTPGAIAIMTATGATLLAVKIAPRPNGKPTAPTTRDACG